jgi:hypothetical protein
VGVTRGVALGVAVTVEVGVAVGVPVGVDVAVAVGVPVGVGLTLGVVVTVGVGVMVGVVVGVAVVVGVGVELAVAVGVGLGGGPDWAQYLPPVFVTLMLLSTLPPQTIISLPLQTAVCRSRPSGTLMVLVAVQLSMRGL